MVYCCKHPRPIYSSSSIKWTNLVDERASLWPVGFMLQNRRRLGEHAQQPKLYGVVLVKSGWTSQVSDFRLRRYPFGILVWLVTYCYSTLRRTAPIFRLLLRLHVPVTQEDVFNPHARSKASVMPSQFQNSGIRGGRPEFLRSVLITLNAMKKGLA